MNPSLIEILSKIDPVALIGDYVALKRTGTTFKGLCPFHLEKTPSFHLNPERGLWHCFGCGAGGDLITFFMKTQNFTFVEARDFLAQKAGITLDKFTDAQSKKRKRWVEILDLSAFFYHQVLQKSSSGTEGAKYLESRGVHSTSIEKFKLGFAPAASQSLLKHLTTRKYELEELRQVGVISRTDPPRDAFYRRIIFPIWDRTGAVIGFGARSLGKEEPKYINSPETPLFKKGENLYALHLAKPQIAEQKLALLAEGYLDVIALHQFGFTQAVATLGTSLTLAQAKLLSQYTEKIVLSYDGDNAGLAAMRRAMQVIQEVDIELEFVPFPDGEDPDSFLQKHGADGFQKLLKQTVSPIDFLIERKKTEVNISTPEGKRKIMNEMIPFLNSISNPILKEGYIQKIIQTLGLSETVVRNTLKFKKEAFLSPNVVRQPSREKEILSWLLWEPSLSAMVWEVLSPDDFQDGLCQEAAVVLYKLWQEGKKSISELEQIPEKTLSLLSRLSNERPIGDPANIQALMKAQKNTQAKKQLSDLKEQVLAGLKEGKVQSTDEAYQKYLTLLRHVKRSEE